MPGPRRLGQENLDACIAVLRGAQSQIKSDLRDRDLDELYIDDLIDELSKLFKLASAAPQGKGWRLALHDVVLAGARLVAVCRNTPGYEPVAFAAVGLFAALGVDPRLILRDKRS